MKVPAGFALLAVWFTSGGCSSTRRSQGDQTVHEVVKLLEDMVNTSKAEGTEDRKMYAKLRSSCDDNEAKKKQEIKDLDRTIAMVSSDIQELEGATGQLSAESAKLKADIESTDAAQAEFEAMRKAANTDFNANQKELSEGIQMLDSAIEELAEIGSDQTSRTSADHSRYMNTGVSFLGTRARGDAVPGSATLLKVKSATQAALAGVSEFLDARQKRAVDSFLQVGQPFGSRGTYSSQSVAIMGVIQNMQDTLVGKLEDAKKKEESEKQAFQAVSQNTADRRAMMNRMFEEKQEILGHNDDTLAQKRVLLKSSKDELDDAGSFVESLLDQCSTKKKMYENRATLRAQEESAIQEAIKILSSEEALKAFGNVAATTSRRTGVSFLQLGDIPQRQLRSMERDLMHKVSGIHQSTLARLTSMIQGNSFSSVLDEIKKMSKVLDAEQRSDEEQLDWCNSERTETDELKQEKDDSIIDLEEQQTNLENNIGAPETGLKTEIAKLQESMGENMRMQSEQTEDRKEEKADYLKRFADLSKSLDLLQRALSILTTQYSGNKAALLQGSHEMQGRKAQGNKALDMLESILSQTEKEEARVLEDEKKAQQSYDNSLRMLKADFQNSQEYMANLQNKLAESKQELLDTEKALSVAKKEKGSAEEYLTKIKPACDFITSNYDYRTKSREEERSALKEAHEALTNSPTYQALMLAKKK